MKKMLFAVCIICSLFGIANAGWMNYGLEKGRNRTEFTITISSTPTAILSSSDLEHCSDYDFVGISGSTFYTKGSADIDTSASDIGTVPILTPVSPNGKNIAPVYGATAKGTSNTTVITGHIYKD